MKRPKETLCNSTGVGNPLLGLYLSRCNGLRGKLEHRCFLTLYKVSQQHHLPVGKFQGIMTALGGRFHRFLMTWSPSGRFL
jgi:hypothetical protein